MVSQLHPISHPSLSEIKQCNRPFCGNHRDSRCLVVFNYTLSLSFFLILGFVCFIHSYHVPNLLVSRAPIANSAAFIQSAFQQEPIVGTLTPLSLNPQMSPTPNVISLLSLSHITLNTHLYSKSRRGPHRTLDILTNIHARCAVWWFISILSSLSLL